jgi:glycerophosphoryl diester phosphodiesterase
MAFDESVPAGAKPLAIAHRGGALLAPENTAEAFRAAAAIGAEFVETDLRLSADGALVCLHDADLSRIAGDPHLVADTDLPTLRALVPAMMTLDEAIAASAPLGLLLDVKLTDPAVLPRLLAAFDVGGATRRSLLGLREIGLIAAARALSPDIAILALVPDPDSAEAARAAGADWFRLWQGAATPERIAAARAAGLLVAIMVGQPRSVAEPGYPPFPVGRIDAEGIDRILALQPDAVMLDDPRLLLAARSVTALSSS